ncbi:hypothetical protein E4U54_008003 [Claviceps lovelessii]|nr:hypothetical protein E4U54_008003 [Claviceps lovelessii]
MLLNCVVLTRKSARQDFVKHVVHASHMSRRLVKQGIRITGGATGMDSTVLVIAYFRGGGDPDSYASVAEQGSKVRKWRPLATTPAACYEKRPSCGSVTHEKRESPVHVLEDPPGGKVPVSPSLEAHKRTSAPFSSPFRLGRVKSTPLPLDFLVTREFKVVRSPRGQDWASQRSKHYGSTAHR